MIFFRTPGMSAWEKSKGMPRPSRSANLHGWNRKEVGGMEKKAQPFFCCGASPPLPLSLSLSLTHTLSVSLSLTHTHVHTQLKTHMMVKTPQSQPFFCCGASRLNRRGHPLTSSSLLHLSLASSVMY